MTMQNSEQEFDLEGRPTFDEMLTWRDNLGGEWATLDQEQESEEDLYFQIFDVESPQGRLAVKTGSAPSDADAAIDSLVPPDISVRVKPAKSKQKYRDQAEKLIRLGKAFLYVWRKQKDFTRPIATDMVIRRVGVARVMIDWRMWPDKPELEKRGEPPPQGEGEPDEDYEARVEQWEDQDFPEEAWETRHRRKCPIVFQVRNPRFTRWKMDETTGEFLVVVEHYQSTVIEVTATYQNTPLIKAVRDAVRGFEPNTPIFVDDIWVGQYRCLVIEDKPIYPPYEGDSRGVQKHEYGEIPYIVMPFRELTFEEMERKYRGMLTNGAGLYMIESNVLTMQIWMLAINAWRTYLGWTKDGRDIEIKPGQYIPVDERIGEYLKMLEGNPVPEELLKTNAVVDSYIQRNSVAQGPRTAEGTRSAQQLWAVQSMRTLKIESAKDSLTRGIARALELAAMMVETNLGATLTLPVPGKTKNGEDMGEVSVSPADINGYWDGFEVSLGRRLDPALLEQWKALQSLATNKWMPERVSYELSGATDNPQEWIDEKVREAVDALPFVLEQIGLERVKNWFGEDSERFIALSQKLMVQQQAQRSPMVPQGGTQQPPGARGQGGGGSAGDAMAQLMKSRGGGRSGGTTQRQQSRPPQGRPVG